MKVNQPALRLVFSRDESTESKSKKYANNRSTCAIPGLVVSRRPIFSNVRNGTPLPSATSFHLPLCSSSLVRTRSKMDSCIETNDIPINGFVQPAHGSEARISYASMPKGTKSRKVPAAMVRAVVAANIESRMELRYAESTNKPMDLAEDAHISLSTVQRILGRQLGASIDTLGLIANALDCSVLELLIPTNDIIRAMGLTRSEAATLVPREWKRAHE